MDKQKICIIGDGLAGLSAAAILSQENIKIDLYIGKKKKSTNDIRATAVSESSYQFIMQNLICIFYLYRQLTPSSRRVFRRYDLDIIIF